MPSRGRPSKKSHIIESAGQLFCELGYQGTSIDLVVQQAEVSKPTVYNNFPSKLVLYKAWQTSELTRLLLELDRWSLEWCDLQDVRDKKATSLYWQSFYEHLFNDKAFLAITRIVNGEPYKLNEDIRAPYQSFLEDVRHGAERHLMTTGELSSDRSVVAQLAFQYCLSVHLLGVKPALDVDTMVNFKADQ